LGGQVSKGSDVAKKNLSALAVFVKKVRTKKTFCHKKEGEKRRYCC